MHWGPLNEIPLALAPRARCEVPYGQLIKLIRMQWGPLNEMPIALALRSRRAARIPIWPANQIYQHALGSVE
eukprot:9287355-Karenia_brevis.AAC.2